MLLKFFIYHTASWGLTFYLIWDTWNHWDPGATVVDSKTLKYNESTVPCLVFALWDYNTNCYMKTFPDDFNIVNDFSGK